MSLVETVSALWFACSGSRPFHYLHIHPNFVRQLSELLVHKHLNNSLNMHEENTKKITTVSVVLYVIKFHVNLHTL